MCLEGLAQMKGLLLQLSFYGLAWRVECCEDLDPHCSPSDCNLRPGYGLFRCQKTCENCNREKCFDSDTVKCSGLGVRKCEEEALLHQYCPTLCGLCTPPSPPPLEKDVHENSEPISESGELDDTCEDLRPDLCVNVTPAHCRSHPGHYFQLCQRTCGACRGGACMDSDVSLCAELEAGGACNRSLVREYCPRACLLCLPALSPSKNGLIPIVPSEVIRECNDSADNCSRLAEYGWCFHFAKKREMEHKCAKTCGHCE